MHETSSGPSGRHLILDFWGGRLLDAPEDGLAVLREAARAAGATEVGHRAHRFPGRGGWTGMLLLAESHISIHTWPEHGYAALDVFLCGQADIGAARAALIAGFAPERSEAREIWRGQPADQSNQALQPAS